MPKYIQYSVTKKGIEYLPVDLENYIYTIDDIDFEETECENEQLSIYHCYSLNSKLECCNTLMEAEGIFEI
jgi:hypothetical protein